MNELLSALTSVNPIWADVAQPFSLSPGVSCHIGGGTPLGAFFITDGVVCTSYEKTVVGLITPGDLVWHHALLYDDPSPLKNAAETPIKGYKVMTKSCRRITEGCQASRRILERYVHLISIEDAIGRSVAAMKLAPHLAYRILVLMDAFDNRDLPFTHTQFMRFLGMNRRASVSEVLDTWRTDGMVEQIDKGLIRIVTPEALEVLAGPAIRVHRERRASFSAFLEAA